MGRVQRRRKREQERDKRRRKREPAEEELERLKKRKLEVEHDIKMLDKEANKADDKAEQTSNVSFVTTGNCLRQKSKEKGELHKGLIQSIAAQEKLLHNM